MVTLITDGYAGFMYVCILDYTVKYVCINFLKYLLSLELHNGLSHHLGHNCPHMSTDFYFSCFTSDAAA